MFIRHGVSIALNILIAADSCCRFLYVTAFFSYLQTRHIEVKALPRLLDVVGKFTELNVFAVRQGPVHVRHAVPLASIVFMVTFLPLVTALNPSFDSDILLRFLSATPFSLSQTIHIGWRSLPSFLDMAWKFAKFKSFLVLQDPMHVRHAVPLASIVLLVSGSLIRFLLYAGPNSTLQTLHIELSAPPPFDTA